MIPRPPRSTRTDTLFPYTTLFRSQHRLFLTATPHNGYTESFTSLLELLDDQRFARNILPDEKQLSQVMIRRLKSDLVDADGKSLYAQRKLKAMVIPYRSATRRVGKVCVSPWRSRWSPYS